MLATKPERLLQAAALTELWESGYVEPIPVRNATIIKDCRIRNVGDQREESENLFDSCSCSVRRTVLVTDRGGQVECENEHHFIEHENGREDVDNSEDGATGPLRLPDARCISRDGGLSG